MDHTASPGGRVFRANYTELTKLPQDRLAEGVNVVWRGKTYHVKHSEETAYQKHTYHNNLFRAYTKDTIMLFAQYAKNKKPFGSLSCGATKIDMRKLLAEGVISDDAETPVFTGEL